MSNIGGALLRVLGTANRNNGEPNPASKSDAFEIIDALMESKELRARCAALANLAAEVPEAERKEICRALLIMMVSARSPQEEPPMVKDGNDNPVPDYSSYRNTTAEYASLAAPRPNSKWEKHVEAKYKKSSAAEYVRVSPYMAEVISAFEALFGVRGALLSQ